MRASQEIFEVFTGIWDTVWLRCVRCSWRQSDEVKRGQPYQIDGALRQYAPCVCGSQHFVVLERVPHPNHRDEDPGPRALQVVA